MHTPAYASLNTTFDDMVLDLSEVIDISECGAAIQTSSPWDMGREIDLCLDLSETKTYVHTKGHVIWANKSGRIGVSFPEMNPSSRRQLREWLFLNAMVGVANYVARHPEKQPDTPMKPVPRPKREMAPTEESRADYTSTLSALAAVQREVESHGTDLQSALRLIADRSRTFTRAEGCAIALSENRAMVCRASSGNAPPVGAKLEIGSGFSGYCVRTGFLQRCDDAETDTRVDRESCRMLGIRSMIALPIREGDSVVGLLEVFSSKAHAFNDRDGTILQRLSDTILTAVNRDSRPSTAQNLSQPPLFSSVPAFASLKPSPPAVRKEKGNDIDEAAEFGFPRRHLLLLMVAACSIIAVLAYLLTPWAIEKIHPTPVVTAASTSNLPTPVVQTPTVPPTIRLGLEEVRKRAEMGDPYEQFALATRYATGDGVHQDYNLALRWFLKAAEQGHVGAQDTLGAYYWLGHGSHKDVTKAYFWSVLARSAGKEGSKVRVAFMTSQLTRAQAQAIQHEANDFLRQHPPLINSESAY